MALEPETQRVLELIAELGLPDVSETTPEVARQMSAARAAGLPPGPDADVLGRTIPGAAGELSVRIYRPKDAAGERLPALVWFHGGGFVLGDLDQGDGDCRQLATLARVVAVSVEYRLAPEHSFPAAPEDCYAALSWVAENAATLGADGARLAVGGDSAGGNLAAVTALMARDRGGPPVSFQLLVYPVTDLTRFDTKSYVKNAEGYFLTRAAMRWFASHYVPRAVDAQSPYASPLLAPDLRGLPRRWSSRQSMTPCTTRGAAFARRLEEAGARVTLSRYASTIHGFFTMHPFLEVGRRAVGEAAEALRAALASG